jgi:hypothetical protein
MRSLLCAGIFLLSFSRAVNAQKIVLLPEIGMQTFTKELRASASGIGPFRYSQRSKMAGVRLLYLSKNGHGPYLGFQAGNENGAGVLNFFHRDAVITRYEAGYQWLSRPIYFKQLWDNGISRQDFEGIERKGLAVQFRPSLGLTHLRGLPGPFSFSTASSRPPYYIHGVSAGLGLMFSNNDKQLFSISANYTKAFYTNAVEADARYQSTKGNGWNLTLGIPITIFKTKK